MKALRRILFLDFDGVLNSSQFVKAQFRFGRKQGLLIKEFCPIAASNLLEILVAVPDLQIVVSSSWRIDSSLDQLRSILARNAGVPAERVIDTTPCRSCEELEERGHEIQRWLDTHPFDGETRFVILDDNSDMAHLLPHLVQTEWDHGLQLSHAREIIKRFAPSSTCDSCAQVMHGAGDGLCDTCRNAKIAAELLRREVAEASTELTERPKV